MFRAITIVSFVGLVLACLATSAQAQGITNYRGRSGDNPVGPTVSPYLNLVTGDTAGVTNYQSLVRPLMEQGAAISYQGNSINRMQQQMNYSGARRATGGATGHATFFMNYSHYYPQPGR